MPKNGNITGQVFDQGVTNQIKYRQNFLGARNKNDSHIIYGNNVNAFLRLASSVDVGTTASPIQVTKQTETADGKKVTNVIDDALAQQKATSDLLSQGKNQLSARNIDQNLTGNKLAKACVLFGGVVGIDNTLNPTRKFGIVDNGGSGTYDYVSTIAAYGWGGISSKGFVPMPSIESADISFYNRGALAKASVKIKVYSVEQLQIFDALYFRIGYTMLLEWGHNTWLDNQLAQDTNNTNPLKTRNEFVTQPFELFFSKNATQQGIINAIHLQREKDSYNYDAMLGKVTNFSWKFNDDGSYDIDLNLVGLGDIIESLKINKAAIISGKTELTPSQLASKKQANIDAGYKNLDASDTAATGTATAVGNTVADKVKDANTKISNYLRNIKNKVKSFPLQGDINLGDAEATAATKEFKRQAATLTIQVSEDKTSNQSALDSIAQFKADYTTWKYTFINEETQASFTKIYGATGKYLYQQAVEIESIIKSINGQDLAKTKADAEKEAELRKKQNDLLRKGLDAASQKLKRDEEIRSLSPDTSVETKNKTVLNLQLYKWRQAAIAAEDPKNLYKLTFTADSSNPSSTGTPKLSLNFYYVRLGHLLQWIQNNLLLYDNTKSFDPNAVTFASKSNPASVLGNQSNLVLGATSLSSLSLSNSIFNSTPNSQNLNPATVNQSAGIQQTQDPPPSANPIFEIDTTTENNFCLRFPAQFSADPKVCIVPSKYTDPSTNIKWDVLSDLQKIAPYYKEGNDYAGNLMNIFVNLDHTAGCVDKNTDANGKTSLLKFLTTLFNDINDALGNVNKLEPVFDAESNQLKIIEGSSLERVEELINAKEQQLNDMAVFQVYGIGTNDTPYGSFVKNVDFQVQLPPNMAAMATISAQASGNIVGENATGLSKLNKGLTDRLITVKLDKDSIEGAETGKADPKVIFQQNLQSVQKVIDSLYQTKFYSKDTIDSIRSSNRDIALYLTGNDALEGNMPAPFFIPFNLSLTMDGLSGMRNYERFSITEQILPYSYRPNSTTNRNGVIDFLIKGISHTIKDNKWETKIESLTVGSNRKWSIQDLQNVSTQNQ